MQEYTLDCASLNLSPDEIFREMGYYKISPQKEISDLVSTLLKEVMEFTRPSYVFKIIEGEVYESWVALEKKNSITCRLSHSKTTERIRTLRYIRSNRWY